MRSVVLLLGLAGTLLLAGCHGNAEESERTPEAKAPPPTAAQNAEAIKNNPNISPEVKKVLMGAGK
jgi:uncharacterized lipoprotein YajG